MQLFVNRLEYSIQAAQPMMNGKVGWYLARDRNTREPKLLDNATIRAHIDGEHTINLYSIHPGAQRSKWVAIDADYDGCMKDLLQLRYELKQDSIQAALEQSRRGGHLWIFAETPLLAADCRIYIYNLALRLGIPVQGGGLRQGIEVFPKQDTLEGKSFGNGKKAYRTEIVIGDITLLSDSKNGNGHSNGSGSGQDRSGVRDKGVPEAAVHRVATTTTAMVWESMSRIFHSDEYQTGLTTGAHRSVRFYLVGTTYVT
jgi:hypothetical protein